MPRFVLSGINSGLLVKGTIDINARANVAVVNKDGTISSVRTSSFGFLSNEDTGKIFIPSKVRMRVKSFEILAPTVIPRNGKWIVVGDSGALQRALSTGLHLGIFDTPKHATAYAIRLHEEQAAAGRKRRATRTR